jgi:hypothetical protein
MDKESRDRGKTDKFINKSLTTGNSRYYFHGRGNVLVIVYDFIISKNQPLFFPYIIPDYYYNPVLRGFGPLGIFEEGL